MAAQRLGSAGSTAGQPAQQQDLVSSLYAAVDALAVCVEHLHVVIAHVESGAQAEPARPTSRARISYGGGPSALAALDPRQRVSHDADTSRPAQAAPYGADSSRPAQAAPRGRASGVPEPTGPPPSTSALMAATELAHQGLNRDEIAERLRRRWGAGAAAILRETME